MKDEDIRKAVREGYGKIAVQDSADSSCCGPANSCGCGSTVESNSKIMGYTDDQLGAIPEGADLGLGCGNPTALASLKKGEVVVDLGSGAGIDCFLAANAVGETGSVIGVDMTSQMLERARENVKTTGHKNVEFRMGEIEHLPIADNSVDVVISNCVINLSPDKGQVFKEAYRVLRPGGRVMISDVVLLKEIPDEIRNSIDAYIGCVAGANTKVEYLKIMEDAGFRDIEVVGEVSTKGMWDNVSAQIEETYGSSAGTIAELSESVVSMKVKATKPS